MKYLIKEVAAKVGLPTHTIRYYEQEGLLPFVKRDENGNRIFDEEDVKWLEFIVWYVNTKLDNFFKVFNFIFNWA
ncbi:MerR family transcriptional regulator [Niallia sp. 03190]|uniref:MerR family transcriptional regulator n=1 Tax=Niallia sp. 03190 TaxID=3458061 RepID=UPI004044E0D2